MNQLGSDVSSSESRTVRCLVAATGIVRATPDELKSLRQSPGPKAGEPLPAAFLKHVDRQTVAGLAAVLQAIDRHALAATCFTDWAVLAAPRFLARVTVAQAIDRFAREGAWGVSPHLIPHCSLHSVSGTISQALKIHGPNFGIGGGPWSAAKALLTAAALLHSGRLPGVWVVVTGWDREPGLQEPDTQPAVCSAAALALRADVADWQGPRLHVTPGAVEESPSPLLGLEALCATLAHAGAEHRWRLDCGGWVELRKSA